MCSGDSDPTLDQPASFDHAPPTTTLRSESPGTRIGPYKLLQLIGEGGFGSVFMAEQERPVQRKVALKILKLGMDTREVVARFEQERQALAIMDHPNIARVLDAGATETGRPFFVMELVKGEPIVAYCDRGSLTIHERLELFAQVCNAVQHAHTKGIIHRDLKPSNILVSTQDGRAHAKVIDFGIAKATASKLTEKTLFTEHRQLIGTPEYMSPEQAEGSLDIDTRTDVYALGVLLYELLTGTTPFSGTELRSAAYAEIQRIIREVDPPKPSTRLSQNTATLAGIAAHRHTEPHKLGTAIRGELDWIVMKALEKDRSRRYETASGLATDINRYLAGEAVVAAPPSAAYRMRKFIRRHRGPVVAAGLVGAALVAGLAGTGVGLVRARAAESEQRRLAASESEQRRVAEASQKKADAINSFLLKMLGSADLREAGRDAKVVQALDLAGADVGTAFKDRPEVEAGIRSILGHTFLSLGMPDKAEPHVNAGLDLNKRLYGETSTEAIKSLADLANIKSQRNDEAGSEAILRAAADAAEKNLGHENTTTLGLRCDLANTLRSLRRYDEAEPILRDTLEIQSRLSGREGVDAQIMVNSLAVLLHEQGRLDEAEKLYREAVETGARVRGPDHPDTITAQFNLASVLRSQGHIDEAEALMIETLARTRKVFGNFHLKTATSLKNLGLLYSSVGRFKDALPLTQEALDIYRRVQGENTAEVAGTKQTVADLLMRMGDATGAVEMQKGVIDVYTAMGGAQSADTLRARAELANYLFRANRPDDSEEEYRELIDIVPKALGNDHPTTIITLNSYAVMLHGQDRLAEAEPLYKSALEAGQRAQGEDHPNTIITMHNLMCVERDLGHMEQADALGRDVVARFSRVFGPKHPNTAVAMASYAETLRLLGRYDDAKAQLEGVLEIRRSALGDEHPDTGGALISLGAVHVDTKDAAGGEPMIREGLRIRQARQKANDPKVAAAKGELGRCLVALGKFTEAESLLLDSEQSFESSKIATPKDKVKSIQRLADLYASWDQTEPGKSYGAKASEWQSKLTAITSHPSDDAKPIEPK